MKYSILIFLFLGLFQTAFAQLTMTDEDVLGIIGHSHYMTGDTSGTVTVDLGSAGADQVWDFSSANQGNASMLFEFIEPQGTPFFDIFPEANFVMAENMMEGNTSVSLYNYYAVSSSAFTQLGLGIEDTVNQYTQLVNERDVAPLPMTYETQWTTDYKDTSDNFGLTLIITYSSTSLVDGWGTIITPVGSYKCLRLRTDYSEDYDYFYGGQPYFSANYSGIDYNWIGPDAFIYAIIESRNGETNPNFTTAESFLIMNDLGSAVDDRDPAAALNDFELIQNYPNPFNASTMIRYTLSATGGSVYNVDLGVFNISGQKLFTLVSESQAAGTHQVRWDAGDFPSGTYFIRLSTTSTGNETGRQNNVQYRKIMLIK